MSRQPYLRLTFKGQRPGQRPTASQLVEAIRDQVQGGSSLEGCRLPPVRVLAHQLGVAKGTIESVYDELKAQGVVESRDRQGLFVAPRNPEVEVPELTRVPPLALKRLSSCQPTVTARPGMLHLSAVFIDPRILPRDRLAACFRSVLKSPGMPGLYDTQGYRPLREWIAERLRGRGIDARADHVVITNGSQQALDIVMRMAATGTVATESPAYFIGKYLMELSGMQAVGLPVDPFQGLDLERWEALLRRHRPGLVYLTTNFQNPSGYSYSTRELSHICRWSREHGFGILEDDWGSDMLSYSEFRPSLRALGGENVLYMNSFTKKLLPSLRIGYLLGSEATISALVMGKRVATLGVPAVMEAGLYEFLDRGYYDTFLRTVQEELDRRYRRCLDLLDRLMPEPVRWTTPGGGPILWLELPRSVSIPRLAARLAAEQVLIEGSEDAFFDEPHLHGFRIGYAFLDPDEMEQALARLSEGIRALL
jgi:DNA-binding transcriptional MocR family regulator